MTDLEIYEQQATVDTWQPRMVMDHTAAKALDDQLRTATRAVLREGVDYGIIPGTNDRQVLLKPGAEKLLQWFGLGFTCDRVDTEFDADGQKSGITYRCTVSRRMPDGTTAVVTTCEGYAGYDEDRFYRPADEQARQKAEARERKYAKIDNRPANPNKWQQIQDYKAPWNTVIKMAQKRAIVGATIDATAAAGLFGQEDDQGPANGDAGATWYEEALEAAFSFTTKQEGDDLYVKAAYAARDGLCTPRQKDHVQNRVRQRQATLKNVTVVETKDLSEAASEPEKDADAAPGDARHKRLVGSVQAQFKRLGFGDDDRADRLWAAAKLAGVTDIESLNDLDHSELTAVAKQLAACKTRGVLEERLAAIAKEGGTDG
jgi:cold shock CspA family protein